jgi:hypothetical protein
MLFLTVKFNLDDGATAPHSREQTKSAILQEWGRAHYGGPVIMDAVPLQAREARAEERREVHCRAPASVDAHLKWCRLAPRWSACGRSGF